MAKRLNTVAAASAIGRVRRPQKFGDGGDRDVHFGARAHRHPHMIGQAIVVEFAHQNIARVEEQAGGVGVAAGRARKRSITKLATVGSTCRPSAAMRALNQGTISML